MINIIYRINNQQTKMTTIVSIDIEKEVDKTTVILDRNSWQAE